MEITRTEHEKQITQREHAKGLFILESNADQKVRTCGKFVSTIVKITRLFDHKTWPTHLYEKFTRCAKVCGPFFLLDSAFRVLIGWTNSDYMRTPVTRTTEVRLSSSIAEQNKCEHLRYKIFSLFPASIPECFSKSGKCGFNVIYS